MVIEKVILGSVARGLRSKNLVFSNEFVNGEKRYFQQIFKNKKTNGLVIKQYSLGKMSGQISAFGYSGETKVLGYNEKKWMPLFDYAKKDSLESAHIPFNIVNTAAPERAYSKDYFEMGGELFSAQATAKQEGKNFICSNPNLPSKNMERFVEDHGGIALP